MGVAVPRCRAPFRQRNKPLDIVLAAKPTLTPSFRPFGPTFPFTAATPHAANSSQSRVAGVNRKYTRRSLFVDGVQAGRLSPRGYLMRRTLPLISMVGMGLLLLVSAVGARDRVEGARLWQPDPASLSQSIVANGAPFTRFTPRSYALRSPGVVVWTGRASPNAFLPPGFRPENRGSALSMARRARSRSAHD